MDTKSSTPTLEDLTAPQDGLVPVIDRIQPLLEWAQRDEREGRDGPSEPDET